MHPPLSSSLMSYGFENLAAIPASSAPPCLRPRVLDRHRRASGKLQADLSRRRQRSAQRGLFPIHSHRSLGTKRAGFLHLVGRLRKAGRLPAAQAELAAVAVQINNIGDRTKARIIISMHSRCRTMMSARFAEPLPALWGGRFYPSDRLRECGQSSDGPLTAAASRDHDPRRAGSIYIPSPAADSD